MPALHRVIQIDSVNHLFYTKGDNNPQKDENPVPFENLIGKVKFSIPYIGYPVVLAQIPIIRIILLACLAVLLVNLIYDFVTGNSNEKDGGE